MGKIDILERDKKVVINGDRYSAEFFGNKYREDYPFESGYDTYQWIGKTKITDNKVDMILELFFKTQKVYQNCNLDESIITFHEKNEKLIKGYEEKKIPEKRMTKLTKINDMAIEEMIRLGTVTPEKLYGLYQKALEKGTNNIDLPYLLLPIIYDISDLIDMGLIAEEDGQIRLSLKDIGRNAPL